MKAELKCQGIDKSDKIKGDNVVTLKDYGVTKAVPSTRPGEVSKRIETSLAEASTVKEIKQVHEEISAVIPVLKQLVKEGRLSFEQLFPILVSKLNAERKAGKMLAEIERNRGGKGIASLPGNDAAYSQVLKECEW